RDAREAYPRVLHPVRPDRRTGSHAVLPVLADPPSLDRRAWHPQTSAELPAPQVVFLRATPVITDHDVISLRCLDGSRLDEQVSLWRPLDTFQLGLPRERLGIVLPLRLVAVVRH